tara:strand:+ start:78 stop:668 length:591 start_codon:yes stop_codon:yes gene_type:complete
MPKCTRKKPKLVCGVGINDADYVVQPKIDGKVVCCNFYRAWRNMIQRCYSEKYQSLKPTYIGCTVTKEWLVFSVFKSWMEKQDWEGKSLDKDILIQSNKIYSSSTCIFVANSINNILTNSTSSRGKYPVGVHFFKSSGKYMSQCSGKEGGAYLGCYDTPQEAHQAYKAAKYKRIAEIANQQSEPLRTALLNYVIEG